MPHGEHFEATNEKYRARDEWSHSQIEVFCDSRPLFHGQFIGNYFPKPESKAFDVGSVVHEALTNPEGLDAILRVIPGEVLNARGARQGGDWKEWSAANAGFIQLKESEMEPIRQMVRSVETEPAAAKFLEATTHREYSIRWQDESTGLWLRARPDLICDLGTMVLMDIKTAASAKPHAFGNAAAKYGYHRQAAWYLAGAIEAGFDVNLFGFIVVEKEPAYECHVYQATDEQIEWARAQNRTLLEDLAYSLEHDCWEPPGYGRVQALKLPDWAREPFELN